MSRFSGQQQKGAMKVWRDKKRAKANKRSASFIACSVRHCKKYNGVHREHKEVG